MTMAKQRHGRTMMQMASRLDFPTPQSLPRLTATLGGFCFVVVLTSLRRRWIGCPFHPLDFLIATAYGNTSTNWFPMLIA